MAARRTCACRRQALSSKDPLYRQTEFKRRQRVDLAGFSLWIVSKEDLILSKLEWAKHALSTDTSPEVARLRVIQGSPGGATPAALAVADLRAISRD